MSWPISRGKRPSSTHWPEASPSASAGSALFLRRTWEWSPQVERMHGYEAGTVHPTTDLVLSHKHPDDYGQVAATLDEIRRTSGAFSTRHRIIDTRGEIHHVVVV